MKNLLKAFVCLLPWPLRRWALQTFFNYTIHRTAKIGLSWIYPRNLVMEEGTRIGDLTAAVHLDIMHLAPHSRIGKGNWITGFPSETGSPHFEHQQNRRSALSLGAHSAITNRHLIDCTSPVTIGKFTTFAGFHSQIISHSIDIEHCRQSSAPVTIGEYCFVGTNCVLLGGSSLPAYSVLGAKSLLNKVFVEEYTLYGGLPARPILKLSKTAAYFIRTEGFVT